MAVIGNGNVALDVARVLAKSADEMAKSDIVPEAGAAIAAAPLTDIHVIGRRGPEHASFTNNELAEMGRLARAVSVTDAKALEVAPPATDPTPERLRKAKNLEILKGFAGHKAGEKPVTVHFLFGAAPKAIRPGEIELTSTGRTLEADLVVTCIGYSGEEFPKRDDVFPVGWAKRGPTGTIPTNRAESHAVAQAGAGLPEGPRSQERARRAAHRRRRRGLAPHRQARGRGRRRLGPPSREIDGLAGAVGCRAGRLTALLWRAGTGGSFRELSC